MLLSELTTLRVGGEAPRVFAPRTRDELVATVLDVWAQDEEWLLLGGGSNVLAGDDEFDGSVVLVRTQGIETVPAAAAHHAAHSARTTVRLRVEAGQSWDSLVAFAVDNGLAGIEGLSGIPGSCGAAPIQNIGAYGQEVGEVLAGIEFLDFETGELVHVPAAELGLGYRTSVLKQGRQGLVVSIDLDLTVDEAQSNAGQVDATGARNPSESLSAPIAYPQLASALGVELGDRVPLGEVRRAVLALRASKGMVLDAADPDSVSAGSFFTNPIVSESFAAGLPADAPRWPIAQEAEPAAVVRVLERDGQIDEPGFASELAETLRNAASVREASAVASTYSSSASGAPEVRLVKLSAAWLIEHAGIGRGFRLPGSRAAVSSKHTLALTNTGGASAADVTELARYIQTRVLSEFGVRMQAEPVLVGTQL